MAPIARIAEGSSADSGNLESSQMELEEELKSSARRSSGLWRRWIVMPLRGYLFKTIVQSSYVSAYFHFFGHV